MKAYIAPSRKKENEKYYKEKIHFKWVMLNSCAKISKLKYYKGKNIKYKSLKRNIDNNYETK